MVYVIISGWRDNGRPKSMCPPPTYMQSPANANGSLRLISSKPEYQRRKGFDHNTFSVSRGISTAVDMMDDHFCPPSKLRQSRGSILGMIGATKQPGHFPASKAKPASQNPTDDAHLRRSFTRSCTSLSAIAVTPPSPLHRHASISAHHPPNLVKKSTPSFPMDCGAPPLPLHKSRHKPPVIDSEYENLDSSASERESAVIRVVHDNNNNTNNKNYIGSKKPPKGFPKGPINQMSQTKQNLMQNNNSFHLPISSTSNSRNGDRRSQSWIWKEPEPSSATEDLSAEMNLSLSNCSDNSTVINQSQSPAPSPRSNYAVSDSTRATTNGAMRQEGVMEEEEDPWFGTRSGLAPCAEDITAGQYICSVNDYVTLAGTVNDSVKGVASSSTAAMANCDANAVVTDYDAETIRRAAARNREVSRKLFQQMQQQKQQTTSVHERQTSNLSEDSLDSPSTRRPLSKTPSQISSTGACSTYTDTSSSSSSSGIGSMSKGNNLYASLRQYHHSQRQSLRMVRSSSSENCAEEGGTTWNTPQQRRNILSMIEYAENGSNQLDTKEEATAEDNVSEATTCDNDNQTITTESEISTDKDDAKQPAATNEFVDNSQLQSRTTSSAAANRGVYRKISSRKRAAREHRQPSPSSTAPILLPPTDNLDERRLSNDSGLARSIGDSPGSPHRSPSQTENSSFPPVYAVPVKLGRSSHSVENMLAAETSSPSSLRCPPPPLPRKPPPPLDDISRPLVQNRFTSSTPCLYENLPGPMDHPPTPTPRQCPPKPPRAFITSQDTPIPAKPTVQVHPMCQQQSTPPVYENGYSKSSLYLDSPKKTSTMCSLTSNNYSFDHTPTERTVSPRPPVPKKPQFLATPQKLAGFAAAVQRVEPERVAPEPAPRMRNRPEQKARTGPEPEPEACDRHMKLSTEEDTCDRLSAFVSQKDEQLRGILLSQPLSSRVCLNELEQSTCNQLTLHIESESSQNNDNVASSVSPNSSYHNTSAGKAKFLVGIYSQPSHSQLSDVTTNELEQKKNELVSSLSRKLNILQEEQTLLEKEMSSNDELGDQIGAWLEESNASPQQKDKYKLHIEETGKITCLMLKLAGQLARVENAIINLDQSATKKEKELLLDRRHRILSQLDDARSLQTSLDRRGEVVSQFLQHSLTIEQFDDYSYFINMKRKLLVQEREIEDKIRLGQEQKQALEVSLAQLSPAISSASSSLSPS